MTGPYYLGHLVRLSLSVVNPPLVWPDYIYVHANSEAPNNYTRCDRHVLDNTAFAGGYDVEWLEEFPPPEDPEEPPLDPVLHQYIFVAIKYWDRVLARNLVELSNGAGSGANDTVLAGDGIYGFADGFWSADVPTTIQVFDPLITDTSNILAFPIGISDANVIYNRSVGEQEGDPTGTIIRTRNFTTDAPTAPGVITLHYDNPGPPDFVNYVGSATQDYEFWRYLDDDGDPHTDPPNNIDCRAQYKKVI